MARSFVDCCFYKILNSKRYDTSLEMMLESGESQRINWQHVYVYSGHQPAINTAHAVTIDHLCDYVNKNKLARKTSSCRGTVYAFTAMSNPFHLLMNIQSDYWTGPW